jgi:hypothetical protein
MSVLKSRVMDLLVNRPAQPLCASCMASMLGVPHKAAHEAALKLEALPAFRRHYGRCSECGKTRIVARAAHSMAHTPSPDLEV